jgi:hypothetical protein
MPAPGARRAIARRVVFYLLFALVTAFTMSKDVFTLGLYLLVVPALVMMAIQWAFLILPLIDWPLTAWRLTHSGKWTAAWFAAAIILPVGFPIAADLAQEARAAIGRLGDKAPAAPATIGGPILISGDCGDQCTRLVRGGAVERVLQAEYHGEGKRYDRRWQSGRYPRATLKLASTYCDKDRRDRVFELRDHPGWCLVERPVEAPRFAAVIHFEGYYGTNRNHGRRRIEVWRCAERCRLVARRTEFRLRPFAVPLRIAYPGGGTYVDPQFKRIAVQRGDADPVAMIKAALGLQMRDGAPRLGEDPFAAARDEAAFRAAEAQARAREETERLARLAASNREREAQLAKIAREREAAQKAREPHPRDCVMTQSGGVFRSSCKAR